jgi:lipopolysaccharide cholinephosphotransferase
MEICAMIQKLSYCEIKNIEFNLLLKFDEICKKYKITYFLADGTLLGAVRHKGFIPWDDDIDVHVHRCDYDKLIDVLNAESKSFGIKVVCLKNNPNCERTFLKICESNTRLEYSGKSKIKDLGVFIDIFPLDNQGNSLKEALDLEKKILVYHSMRNLSVMESIKIKSVRDFIKLLCFPFAKIFGTSFWVNKVDKLMQSKNKQECCFYGSNQPSSIICDKSVFDSAVMLEFEGKLFPAPVGYDEYLRYHYGDYMTLPPVEKRVAKHNFDAFKEEP